MFGRKRKKDDIAVEVAAGSQPGPCKLCGAKDYPLSYGGPDVCPACDTGFKSYSFDSSRLNLVSSMSMMSVMISASYSPIYPATLPPSDEYKEFLRWKKNREEEAQEEPPPLERPLRLIELEGDKHEKKD